MTPRVLWKLSIATSAQAEEAVVQLLAARFGQTPAVYSDFENGTTAVDAYLPAKPEWSKGARARLADALRYISGPVSGASQARVTLKRLRTRDWVESWKRHFKPLHISRRLLVKPTWSRVRARHGQAEVVLDPGLSFGTGQHPTTHFCLSEVARHRQPGHSQSLLDLGTGSGILAIAAAKLGYQPVAALDWDRDAIRVARGNARMNKVSRSIQFKCRDLAAISRHCERPYSVVCANLTAELLLSQTKRILARIEPGGLLVLAGILKSEFPRLQSAYEAAGLRLVRSRAQREWRSASFIRYP